MATLGRATNPSSYTNKQENRDWYKSMGLDYAGDNEISAVYKRLLPSLAEQAFSGQALRSELEPQRQSAVRSLVELGDPANLVSNASAAGGRIRNDSFAMGRLNANRLGQLGVGTGTQFGAVADAQNQGVEASNRLMSQAYSPEQQAKALVSQLQAISQAGGDPLQILMEMFAPIEQRSMANKASKSSSGLGAILGSILPGVDFSKLFGGGSGIGNAASLAIGGIGGGLTGAG